MCSRPQSRICNSSRRLNSHHPVTSSKHQINRCDYLSHRSVGENRPVSASWEKPANSLSIAAAEKWHGFPIQPKPAVEFSHRDTGPNADEVLLSLDLGPINILILINEFRKFHPPGRN